MFEEFLIESAGRDTRMGGWRPTLLSCISHAALISAVMMAGYAVKENPEGIDRPMAAFIVSPAPPPPPPPPPGPSSNAARTSRVEMPREPSRPAFEQPREMPRELHEVAENAPARENASSDDAGGMPGGAAGGTIGGQNGGQLGGELGGVIGGQLGGKTGGKIGGQIGGTGDAPVRVGGNVLPPKIVSRVDPQYTEAARRAKIEGIVIIEAVIDQHGDVTEARILKPLAFGLDQQALNAIRAWKFRPGTLNGQPVRVVYNLTVKFQIE